MGALGFLASAISSVVWPATVLALAYFAREPLKALIARLATVKYGDVEVGFEPGLQRLEAKVVRKTALTEAVPEKVRIEALTASPTEASADRFAQVVDVSPAAAIIEASLSVEYVLEAIARHYGISPPSRRSMLLVTRLLHQKQVIDQNTVEILEELRRLRNLAAHAGSREITRDEALRFKELSDAVISILSKSAD